MTRSVVRLAIAAVSFSLGFAALAACSPPATTTESVAPAPVAAADCAASAARTWTAGGVAYAVTVATSGATCADAVATLTVKSPDGALVHTETLVAAQTFGLNAAADPKAMGDALTALLDPGTLATTGDLPAWDKGADGPGGEFPFIPEDGVDRAVYEKLRAAKTPVLCYIQGGESYGCWRLDGATMVKIGAQTFPG